MPTETAPAMAILTRFLASFATADGRAAAGLFWPDALFWGTTSPELATEAHQVQAYFSSFAQWRPDQRRAEWISGEALPLSDGAVMISGRWQIVHGESLRPLRLSMLVTRRGEGWGIAQFHNSARPV